MTGIAERALEPGAIAAWADTSLGSAVDEGRAVGCVAAVTDRVGVVWSAGYGWADRAAGVRADPIATPFRSGSTSKVMTAALAWQLIEEGRLGLDDDIDRHLARIPVPSTFGPITIRHLLQHSAGFEERFRDTLTRAPLPERVPANELRRIWCRQRRPAGITIAYSNFSIALLATILEDVTGRTYRELITERILDPLEMTRSGLELPGHLPANHAAEHRIAPDGTVVQPPLLLKVPFYLGSGGLFYSAEDAAAFLRTFLPGAPHTLLGRDSLDAMRRPVTGVHGGAFRGLGWWLEDGSRGQILRHGGQTESFRAVFHVLPDEGYALVVMCVGDRMRGGRGGPSMLEPDDVAASFAEAFTGAAPGPATPFEPSTARPVPGPYRETRSVWSTSERLVELLRDEPMPLRRTERGLTFASTPLVADGDVWVEEESRYPIAFVREGADDLLIEGSSTSQRVSWCSTRVGIVTIAAVSLLASIVAALVGSPSPWSLVALAVWILTCGVVTVMVRGRANVRLHGPAPALLAVAMVVAAALTAVAAITRPADPTWWALLPLAAILAFHRAHRYRG